jgi:deazaflavin-dependent oxidoreductase (nitroreductase family)
MSAPARAGHPHRRTLLRSLAARAWNAVAWLPALADRRGLRWLLSGRLIGAPIVVLTHRGRRSGRIYRTPVEALADRAELGEVVVSPMRGRRGDWYRNVLAGGLIEASLRGDRQRPAWRELDEGERRAALDEYLRAHPLYGKLVLRMLMVVHGLEGTPAEVVAREIPMLALRMSPRQPAYR